MYLILCHMYSLAQDVLDTSPHMYNLAQDISGNRLLEQKDYSRSCSRDFQTYMNRMRNRVEIIVSVIFNSILMNQMKLFGLLPFEVSLTPLQKSQRLQSQIHYSL